MEKTVYIKENGKIAIKMVSEEEIKEMSKECPSPCFVCDNGYCSKCGKIADEQFKTIDKYDYITDGFQVCSSNGEVEDLFIKKCNNYVKDHPRPKAKTREELENLKRLKESIRILYFNASDIDEAKRIHSDLIRRGQLIMMDEVNKCYSDNAKSRSK